jgi:hypothetical protein
MCHFITSFFHEIFTGRFPPNTPGGYGNAFAPAVVATPAMR